MADRYNIDIATKTIDKPCEECLSSYRMWGSTQGSAVGAPIKEKS
jgi:hypothetical protein